MKLLDNRLLSKHNLFFLFFFLSFPFLSFSFSLHFSLLNICISTVIHCWQIGSKKSRHLADLPGRLAAQSPNRASRQQDASSSSSSSR